MNVLRYKFPRQLRNLGRRHDFHNQSKLTLTPLHQSTCSFCGLPISRKGQNLLASPMLQNSYRYFCNYRMSSSHILLSLHTWPRNCNLHIPSTYPAIGILQPVIYKSTVNSFPSRRKIHTSRRSWAEESKVGKTIKVLEKKEKDKAATTIGGIKEVEKLIKEHRNLNKVEKSLWEKVKNEIKHNYHGFRLLMLDVRVSIRIAWGLMKGGVLSRRERKQLVRTLSDIFRLVPFMVFLIIPFMELLLPFYLKFFPFMLPSTFKEEAKEKYKNLQNLKGKLEMAKFLQDTLMQTSVVGKIKDQTQAEEFHRFLQQVRESGQIPKDEDIMNYCSLFEDDITLDTLTHEQLKALCKLLEITPIGPSAVLRLQLELQVRTLKADDYAIARDGVEKMAVWELITACRERGMRALGLSEERLRRQLEQWLHLHLELHIPITLLLITRTMYLPEQLKPEEQLTEFILRMPQTLIDRTELSVAERAAERIDPKKKYDVIKSEQEAIALEKEEKAREIELEETDTKAKEKLAAEVDPEAVAEPVEEKPTPDVAPTLAERPEEELVDKAPVVEGLPDEELEPKADLEKDGLTVSDLQELETIIASKDTTAIDEEDLKDLKEDIVGYETDVRRMEAMAVVRDSDITESKPARRLVSQVNKMIGDMDSIVNQMHEEKESLIEEIEIQEVRMRHARGEDAKRELQETIETKKERVVDINDLMLSIRRVQRLPDETRWQKIFEVLDEDHDGKIELHHVMKVLDMLGTDNVKLTPEQMNRILDTIDKESIQERLEMQRKLEQVDSASDKVEKEKSSSTSNDVDDQEDSDKRQQADGSDKR